MFSVWTDSNPERETVHAPSLRAAAEAYARARVDDIDGEPVNVQTEDGAVHRYVVRNGQATPEEAP
jgi:hypothetical protein